MILRICLEFSAPAMRIFSLPVLLSVVSNAPLKVLVPEFVKVRYTGAALYASLELVRSDLYCFVISMYARCNHCICYKHLSGEQKCQ